VKPISLTLSARPFRRRTPPLAVLGCLAFAVQIACSDAPTQGGTGTTFPTAGTAGGGTALSMAGTSAASGSFSSSGSFGTAGNAFETGGTGGSATTAGTSSGGTAVATAGTGGTVVVNPTTPYCMGKPVAPLPYKVESNYYPSGWSEGPPAISAPTDLAFDACTKRVAGAVGDCTKWRYTPQATPAPVWVIWAVPPQAPAATAHACVAEGANSIAFCARGEKGGEKIMTGGASVNEAEITLTAEWKTFTVPLTGVTYDTFENGVPTGFVWKIVPPAANAAVTEFFIDKIQFVKDAPTADYCAGSLDTGGAGGIGGTGGSGGSGGSAGGSGGSGGG